MILQFSTCTFITHPVSEITKAAMQNKLLETCGIALIILTELMRDFAETSPKFQQTRSCKVNPMTILFVSILKIGFHHEYFVLKRFFF
jgi:hypothetical protein